MRAAWVALVLVVAGPALAGPMSDALPRLNDEAVARMLPVMRLEAAQVDAMLGDLQEAQAASGQFVQLVEDIGTGKVDPLTWLKAQSKYAIAPPSARYEPKLSIWVSSSYFARPTAVFSLGIKAPEKVTKAARDGEEGLAFILGGQDLSNQAGGKEFEAAIRGVVSFYEANKFKPEAVQHFFHFITYSPDTSVAVFVEWTNRFTGSPASEGVPDGPLMWLWATTPDAGPEDLEVAGEAAQDSLALQMALAGAGMTYERYKEYLGALAIAKTDAGDPASLDIPLGDPMLSAEQDQALEDMREFYAIRKANLKVYQRMAARVEPLLVKMGM